MTTEAERSPRAALLDALARYGIRPDRRFGQNFLFEAAALEAIADSAELAPGDTVVEVGCGAGTLTRALLARIGDDGCLLGYELDLQLAGILGALVDESPAFHLRLQDALEAEPLRDLAALGREGPAALVANLPYYLTTPLLYWALTQPPALWSSLTVMVQREAGARLAADVGSARYGPLAVLLQSFGALETGIDLPPHQFYPMPGVRSRVYHLRRAGEDGGRWPLASARLREDGPGWLAALQSLFAGRRKQLLAQLRALGADEAALQGAQAALAARGLDLRARAEQLDPDALAVVAPFVPPGR